VADGAPLYVLTGVCRRRRGRTAATAYDVGLPRIGNRELAAVAASVVAAAVGAAAMLAS
jgi:hypothetical protein